MADSETTQPAEPPTGTPQPLETTDPPAQSLDTLIDLALPQDVKLFAQIRPLARDLLIQLDPQDAGERMLAVQMIAAFSRGILFSRNLHRQKHHTWFSLFANESDRAMALFRRQMQTLSELRRPRRSTFTAIRQANIAGQQIVVTDPKPDQLAQSATAQLPTPSATTPIGHERPLQTTEEKIPSQQSRPARVAKKHSKKPPLATKHRPAHAPG